MYINPASYLETVCLRLQHDDPCLTQLDLGTSMIQNRGATVLKRVLSTNTKLRHLGLFNNHMDEDGIVELAEALKANNNNNKDACRLEVLYLGNNRIGNRGAAALGEALVHNKSLKKLHLSNGSIGVDGAKALARGLAQNTTLEYLDLQKNPAMGRDGIAALRDALQHNNMTLKTLKVDSHLNTGAHEAIQTYLRLNRFGRVHALRNSTLPHNAWTHVLSKASGQPDLLYLLVSSKPDLFEKKNRTVKNE
jgi:Ran GTPase-activating protein (RanGAP) involved in mRNA processing and transport